METKTMENLHEDVLLEIFEWLDRQSLLQSALVCQRWNEIIGSSSNTMKKFMVNLKSCQVMRASFRWNYHLEQLNLTDRKFVNVKIQCLTEKQNAKGQFTKIIETHRYSLRSIKLEMIVNLNPQTVMNMLALMPNLEWVTLSYSKFDTISNLKVEKLKSLKHLKMYGTDLVAVELFSHSKLTSLEIRVQLNAGVEHLANFLSSQKDLQKIILKAQTDDFFSLLFDEKFEGFSEKLTKFSFEYLDETFSGLAELNFLNFLKLRGSNLRVLEMKGVLWSSLFAYIMSDLKCLRKLTVDAYEPLKDKFLEGKIQSSSSIRELNILQCVSTKHRKRVQFCLSLLTVPIRMYTLGRMYSTATQDIRDYSLHEMTIVKNLEFLLKKNPTIKKFSLQDLNFCLLGKSHTERFVEIFQSKFLKHIEISGESEPLNDFFKYLDKADWRHVDTLKINMTRKSIYF